MLHCISHDSVLHSQRKMLLLQQELQAQLWCLSCTVRRRHDSQSARLQLLMLLMLLPLLPPLLLLFHCLQLHCHHSLHFLDIFFHTLIWQQGWQRPVRTRHRRHLLGWGGAHEIVLLYLPPLLLLLQVLQQLPLLPLLPPQPLLQQYLQGPSRQCLRSW